MAERLFHYYEMHGGRKIRFRMVLDQHNVLVRREPVETLPTAAAVAAVISPEEAAYHASLRAKGYEFNIRPTGQMDLLYVPPLEEAITRFYVMGAPCFFEGCEALRAQWKQLLSENSVGGEPCPACTEGQLMRQFRDVLAPVLEEHLKNGQA